MNPDEFSIKETFLEVGDGHTLYVHEWGNPKSEIPFVYLHGGPGSGSKDRNKNGFDPARQRVIFFDQRGSGKSLPYGSIEHNTTKDLVEDIEKIAKHLNLDQFILTGASWGPTLAFAYALKYPKRVKAMVLGGIFTGSKAEIDWIYQGKFRNFFPDVWQQFLNETPESHRENPAAFHLKQALGSNELAAKKSLYTLTNLEAGVMSLDDRHTPDNFDDFDPAGSKIEVHYLANRCFLPDRYILDNARKLKMPVWMIQGRYDFVCPPKTAFELHQKLPESHLVWSVSGHRSEHETWNLEKTIRLQLAEDLS